MKKSFIFLVCTIIMGCELKEQVNGIDWKIANTLPDSNGIKNIGVAGPITGILANKLVIIGGANFPTGMPWEGAPKAYQKEYYVYEISQNGELKLTQKADYLDSVAYAANATYQNKLYAVGGEHNGIATSDVTCFYFENEVLKSEKLASLPIELTNGSSAVIGGYLYFVGGENSELVSSKILRLNLDDTASTWEDFLELPMPITHSVSLSGTDNDLIIVGGRKRNTNAKSDIYKSVFSIDLQSKKINTLPDLPENLAAGTAVNYQGNIIVMGGDNGSTFHKVEQLIGEINLSTDDNAKKSLTDEKNKIQRTHPGFSKKVYVLNPKDSKWELLNELNGESPVTTTALLKDNLIIIPSGEVRAGVRTNQILTGKLN